MAETGHQRPRKEEEAWWGDGGGVAWAGQRGLGQDSSGPSRSRNRRSLTDQRRNSVLPLQWRMRHSSRWMVQVVASEFSLVGFLLLLVMVFSKKWLYPSKSRFHQRYPKNITNRVYTSIHKMSTGLLYVCLSGSCSGKGESLHPIPGLQPALTPGVAPSLAPSYQPSSFDLQDGSAGMVASEGRFLPSVWPNQFT